MDGSASAPAPPPRVQSSICSQLHPSSRSQLLGAGMEDAHKNRRAVVVAGAQISLPGMERWGLNMGSVWVCGDWSVGLVWLLSAGNSLV